MSASLNNEGSFITRSRNISYFLIIACCLVAVGSVLFVSRAAIVTQLNHWRVLPEPERVTELYFANYAALPKSFAVGSHHTVAFTVHNLEHRATVYHYRLVAVPDNTGAEHNLGDGTFMLDHDGVHVGDVDFVVPPPESQVVIKVELYFQDLAQNNNAPPVQTQSIDFRAAVTKSRQNEAAL